MIRDSVTRLVGLNTCRNKMQINFNFMKLLYYDILYYTIPSSTHLKQSFSPHLMDNSSTVHLYILLDPSRCETHIEHYAHTIRF